MNMLASLKSTPDVKIAEEKDSVGGNSLFDSGLYLFRVGMAYIAKSGSGSLGLNLTLVGPDKKELRTAVYMTGGDAKGNKPYYTKDGVNYPLPGFTLANSLAMLTTGKEIGDLDTEEKVIKIYDFTAKAEVPTKVQAVTELIGQEIYAGVLKQIDDKSQKNDAGVYVATGETREANEIDKFFCARETHLKMTTTEVKAGAEEAAFFKLWEEKNVGTVRDKSKGAPAGGTAGAPAKAGAAAGTAKPKQSLFGGAPAAE